MTTKKENEWKYKIIDGKVSAELDFGSDVELEHILLEEDDYIKSHSTTEERLSDDKDNI